MPRFVFDTNVLINYIRYDDQEVHDALTVTADLGEILISQISVLEMWAPVKWKIKEESSNLVPLWIWKLEEGEVPAGMQEVLLYELNEHQQPLPNQFFVDTRRKGRRWSILDENKQLVAVVEYTGNSIILMSPDIRRSQVEQEISILKHICKMLNAQIIPVSKRAQDYAELIVQHYRDTLGRNSITDSLIIATGLTRRAWLVTDDNNWQRVKQDMQNRSLPLPEMKVIDPTRMARGEVHS